MSDPIIDRRKRRLTYARIVAETGLPLNKVRTICVNAGLGFGPGRNRPRRFDHAEPLRMRQDGATYAAIGEPFGVSQTMAWKAVRNAESSGQMRAA
jgi:hypothetical protein